MCGVNAFRTLLHNQAYKVYNTIKYISVGSIYPVRHITQWSLCREYVQVYNTMTYLCSVNLLNQVYNTMTALCKVNELSQAYNTMKYISVGSMYSVRYITQWSLSIGSMYSVRYMAPLVDDLAALMMKHSFARATCVLCARIAFIQTIGTFTPNQL